MVRIPSKFAAFGKKSRMAVIPTWFRLSYIWETKFLPWDGWTRTEWTNRLFVQSEAGVAIFWKVSRVLHLAVKFIDFRDYNDADMREIYRYPRWYGNSTWSEFAGCFALREQRYWLLLFISSSFVTSGLHLFGADETGAYNLPLTWPSFHRPLHLLLLRPSPSDIHHGKISISAIHLRQCEEHWAGSLDNTARSPRP
jgi:hypothetical protein